MEWIVRMQVVFEWDSWKLKLENAFRNSSTIKQRGEKFEIIRII